MAKDSVGMRMCDWLRPQQAKQCMKRTSSSFWIRPQWQYNEQQRLASAPAGRRARMSEKNLTDRMMTQIENKSASVEFVLAET